MEECSEMKHQWREEGMEMEGGRGEGSEDDDRIGDGEIKGDRR